MKKLALLFCLFYFINSNAQEGGFASQIGYSSFAGSNFYVGIDYKFKNVTDGTLNCGLGTFIGEFNTKSETSFVPEMHINYSLAYFFLGEMSVTSKSINPSLGLNLFNAIKIKAGYNFRFQENSYNGLTFGITISTGQKGYFEKFKFM